MNGFRFIQLVTTLSFLSLSSANASPWICLRTFLGNPPGLTRTRTKLLSPAEYAFLGSAEKTNKPIRLVQAIDSSGKIIAEVKIENAKSVAERSALDDLLYLSYKARGPLKNIADIKITTFEPTRNQNSRFDNIFGLIQKNMLESYSLNHVSVELNKIRRAQESGIVEKESIHVSSATVNGKNYDLGKFSVRNKSDTLQRLIRSRLHNERTVQEEKRRPAVFNPVLEDIRQPGPNPGSSRD